MDIKKQHDERLEQIKLELKNEIISHMEDNFINKVTLAKMMGAARQRVFTILHPDSRVTIDALLKVCFALGMKVNIKS